MVKLCLFSNQENFDKICDDDGESFAGDLNDSKKRDDSIIQQLQNIELILSDHIKLLNRDEEGMFNE